MAMNLKSTYFMAVFGHFIPVIHDMMKTNISNYP